MNREEYVKKRPVWKRILLAYFVTAVFALGIFAIYAWQQHKTDDLNTKINNLTKQLNDAKTQLEQKDAALSKASGQQPPADVYTSPKSVVINVYSPKSGVKVTSPLVLLGQVPGGWSFEASFPIKLLDSKGRVVAQTTGQVLGDWMTANLVPFSAKLTWSTTESGSGTLVLQKDNPSGLAENDDSISIPIIF